MCGTVPPGKGFVGYLAGGSGRVVLASQAPATASATASAIARRPAHDRGPHTPESRTRRPTIMKLEPSPGTAPRREPGHGHNELIRLHRVVSRTVQQSGPRRGIKRNKPAGSARLLPANHLPAAPSCQVSLAAVVKLAGCGRAACSPSPSPLRPAGPRPGTAARDRVAGAGWPGNEAARREPGDWPGHSHCALADTSALGPG
jgi:hypothetical protein